MNARMGMIVGVGWLLTILCLFVDDKLPLIPFSLMMFLVAMELVRGYKNVKQN